MKKYIYELLTAILVITANDLPAQITPTISTDTSTTEGLLHYILQPLDKSQISTGFLAEYGAPILPMTTFNGTLTDSNRIDMNLWRTLYFQLQTAYCENGTNPLAPITTVNSTIRQNMGDSLPVPIPLLIGQYNSVKSNAFSSNLLSYNSSQNQVHDVVGRPQNPYQTNNLLAACPNNSYTLSGTATFVCKPSLVWNNTGKSIISIQINFANGDGFKNVTMNTPITVSYGDTGTVRWTIKVTLSDNTVLQCYSNYKVMEATSSLARYSPTFANEIWDVPSTANYQGATVFISYTSKNRTNTMRKPLIVVEGYDVSSVAPDIQQNYSYRDFIDALDDAAPFDFNQHLDDLAGYDLVFIDFDDGTDDIRDNAALVEHIIDMVNDAKAVAGSTEQNVVMGLSMGGLVARYALAEMTKNGVDPETRLLITHDSPHRGANVPLGIQYLIEMAGHAHLFGYDVRDIYAQYDEAIDLLAEPATQQLLLYRATGPNTFASNNFLDGDYRNMVSYNAGDPQPAYRFIATADGSQCGHTLFTPHHRLFYTDDDVFLFLWPILSYRLRADIRAYALPVTGSTDMIARVLVSSKFKLFGFITIAKQVYFNTAYAPGTQLPVDGAAGSTSPLISDVTAPQVNTSFPILPVIFGLWGAVNLHASGDPTTFSFVPTASALDVNPFNTAALSTSFVDGYNADFISRSATYIAQETITGGGQTVYNNAHIRFTARNSEWLYDEMEGISNTLYCSTECSPVNNFSIQGDDNICTSAIYSISGVPGGMNITWSASPSGIVSLVPNGSQVTVTKISSGNIILTATMNSCSNFAVHKPVTIGTQKPGPISFPYVDPYIGRFRAEVDPVPGATSYNWYKNGTFVSGQHNASALIATHRNDCGSVYDVGVEAISSCGTSLQSHEEVYMGSCLSPYIISPNPTSDQVSISSNASVENIKFAFQPAIPATIKAVKIIDLSGRLIKQFQYPSGTTQTNIDISSLPAGTYLFSIYNEIKWYTKQVVIVR